MSRTDEIMEQAQEFASGWSIVGGRFDGGDALEIATESKAMLRNMIAAAIADAERRGAEAMRTQCALVCDTTPPHPFRPSIEAAHAIRAMPLPTGQRPVVRLTDEQIGRMYCATLGEEYVEPTDDEADKAAHAALMRVARAIETAVLAANGLETK